MSELLLGSICLDKIREAVQKKHSAFKQGKDGKTYAAINIWVNDSQDQYGNNLSIQLASSKEKRDSEDKVYIGNGKTLKETKQPKQDTNNDPF